SSRSHSGDHAQVAPALVPGLGPVAEPHRIPIISIVSQRDPREVGAAKLPGALADALEDRVEVEGGGKTSGHLVEDLGFPPPILGLAVEPRVLERERRLVGKGLENADLGGREHTPQLVGDGQGPDDLALDPQRNGEDRAIARLLETSPTSASSRLSVNPRAMAARASASRRRCSASPKSRAFLMASAACAAKRPMSSRSSSVGSAPLGSETLRTPSTSSPSVSGTTYST